MSTTDLFGDFCLACDRQTNGTSFCSQACRLAELELYTGTESLTYSYDDTHHTSSTGSRSSSSAGSKFQLPPAYDFSSHRQSSSTSLATAASSTLSSSPSSPKGSSFSKLTDKARNELRDYAGGFDQTRTVRRRVSMQSN